MAVSDAAQPLQSVRSEIRKLRTRPEASFRSLHPRFAFLTKANAIAFSVPDPRLCSLPGSINVWMVWWTNGHTIEDNRSTAILPLGRVPSLAL